MLELTRIIYLTFIKYFRPLHKLMEAVYALQTTTTIDRQNSEITDRQTFLIFDPFVSRFFSGSCKKWEHRFT